MGGRATECSAPYGDKMSGGDSQLGGQMRRLGEDPKGMKGQGCGGL